MAPEDVDNTTVPAAQALAAVYEQLGFPIHPNSIVAYAVAQPVADVPVAQIIADAAAAEVDLSKKPLHLGIKTQPDDADGNRVGAILSCGRTIHAFRTGVGNADILSTLVQSVSEFYEQGTPKGVVLWDLVSRQQKLLTQISSYMVNLITPPVQEDGGF